MANALAPLMYQPANPAEYFAEGQEQGNALRLRQAIEQYGPAAIQGDQNALAALARIDPSASMGLMNEQSQISNRTRATDQNIRDSEERLKLAYESARQETEAHAAKMSAAEKEAAIGDIQMITALSSFQTPEEWDAAADQLELDQFIGQFDQRDGLMAMAKGVADALGGAGATTAVQSLQQRAEMGGLQPGTPEFQDYMLNGGVERTQDVGPTFRAMTPEEMEAYRAPPGSQIDTKTGRAYPAETRDTTTEGERKGAGMFDRMVAAEQTLDELAGEGATNTSLFERGLTGVGVPEGYALSPQSQRVMQAQRDWVRAKLRLESGAVIGDEEMAEEIRTYFPQPGEDPATAAQKKQARAQAMEQVRTQAGRATSGMDAPAATDIPQQALDAGIGADVWPLLSPDEQAIWLNY